MFAPSGAAVAQLRSNSQANFTLPEAGTYVIRVSAANLATTGSYNLNFECIVPPSPDAVPLSCGTLGSGQIGARGQVDLFTLSGLPGQIIALALASTGGFSANPTASTSVELWMFAPSGAAVAQLRSNSQANFTLPEAGTYVIRVSATNLATTGSYNLNFECIVPPSPDAVPLTCGTLGSGQIECARPGAICSRCLDCRTDHRAGAGQHRRVLGESNREHQRRVVDVRPVGAAVAQLLSNSQANFTLPEAGTYVIRVSATNLATTGSYNLNFECMLPPSPDAVPLSCARSVAESVRAARSICSPCRDMP